MDDRQEQGGVHISIGGSNSGSIAVGNNISQTPGGGAPPPAAAPESSPAAGSLRAVLAEAFTDDDLRDLCFDMSIDYESLPGDNKSAKARELVLYCQKRGRLEELAGHVRRLRPNRL